VRGPANNRIKAPRAQVNSEFLVLASRAEGSQIGVQDIRDTGAVGRRGCTVGRTIGGTMVGCWGGFSNKVQARSMRVSCRALRRSGRRGKV
jgi:hypothetical protein